MRSISLGYLAMGMKTLILSSGMLRDSCTGLLEGPKQHVPEILRA